jgi:hypothetical protein
MVDSQYLQQLISNDPLTKKGIDKLAADGVAILRPRHPGARWVVTDDLEKRHISGPVILLPKRAHPVFDFQEATHGVLHVYYVIGCTSYIGAQRTTEGDLIEVLISREARRLLEKKRKIVDYAIKTLGRPSLVRSLGL